LFLHLFQNRTGRQGYTFYINNLISNGKSGQDLFNLPSTTFRHKSTPHPKYMKREVVLGKPKEL